jgi:hypothetical protein
MLDSGTCSQSTKLYAPDGALAREVDLVRIWVTDANFEGFRSAWAVVLCAGVMTGRLQLQEGATRWVLCCFGSARVVHIEGILLVRVS